MDLFSDLFPPKFKKLLYKHIYRLRVKIYTLATEIAIIKSEFESNETNINRPWVRQRTLIHYSLTLGKVFRQTFTIKLVYIVTQ